jgi:hypothetical protein
MIGKPFADFQSLTPNTYQIVTNHINHFQQTRHPHRARIKNQAAPHHSATGACTHRPDRGTLPSDRRCLLNR